MRKSILLGIALIFTIQSIALGESGEISGTVYNGTADSSVVKHTDVEFLIYRGHDMIDDSSYVQKTNSVGRYRLANVPLDSTLIYYPRVNFKSIVYYGRGARLTESNTKVESDVVVYDTTSQKNNILIQMEHLFLSAENGTINFREIFLLANQGKKTYLGKTGDHDQSHHVLEFILPKNHKNVELLSPDTQNLMIDNGNRLIDTSLFPPGSRQLSFQFQVPFKGDEWHYSRPILYPTGSVNIFLDNPNFVLEGPGLESMGEFSIRGKNYMRYTIPNNLMPGMQMELTLKNLPGTKISLEWITLIVVGIFLVSGFAYTFFKNKNKS